MDFQHIKTSISDRIGIISLSDPTTLNALSLALAVELRQAFDAFAEAGSGVRCVVLTGEGRGFCSGANLAGRNMDETPAGEFLNTTVNPLMSVLRDYPVPIVTAVNGVAAGVGCSLALMGDLIVAAESSYFMLAFRRIGLVPDGGATYILPRQIGKARAMELTLLGDKLPAKTALEWGLVNRCVPDAELMPTTLAIAKQLAEGPKALGYIRKLVHDGLETDWEEQLAAEAATQNLAGRTKDCREGVLAFQEKRPAVFTGE